MVPSSLGMPNYAPVPSDEDVTRAADVLNAGDKVAILIGQGARGHGRRSWPSPTGRRGRRQGAAGKDALDDDLPYVTGSIGLLGPGRRTR